MAWIETIAPQSAKGLLAKIYQSAVKRAGRVFNILRVQSLNPATLQSSLNLYITAIHKPSPLSRARREMLATVVSRINECHY